MDQSRHETEQGLSQASADGLELSEDKVRSLLPLPCRSVILRKRNP